jgi:Pyridoxamine 5'-phosphate oxidase
VDLHVSSHLTPFCRSSFSCVIDAVIVSHECHRKILGREMNSNEFQRSAPELCCGDGIGVAMKYWILFFLYNYNRNGIAIRRAEQCVNMGKVLSEISAKEAEFIASQKVFFVATAALSKDHHVSVSPKANDGSFVIVDPLTVAYADLTGSGAETAAHVLQNQRMTLMFCNIETGPPKILRLFGRADVVLAENVSLSLLRKFPSSITQSYGFRAVYILRVHRISSSCGFSLPIMEFTKFRSTLTEVTEKEGKEGMSKYITLKNSYSIDGLPSLALLRKDAPPNVVPVLEEGYILGKEIASPDTKGIARKFNLRNYRIPKLPKQFYLHTWNFIFSMVAVFISGIATGMFILRPN